MNYVELTAMRLEHDEMVRNYNNKVTKTILAEEEEQAFIDEILADFDEITASKRFVRGKIGDLTGSFH